MARYFPVFTCSNVADSTICRQPIINANKMTAHRNMKSPRIASSSTISGDNGSHSGSPSSVASPTFAFVASFALVAGSTLVPLSAAMPPPTTAPADESVETSAVAESFLISSVCESSGGDTWLGSDTVILDVQYDE